MLVSHTGHPKLAQLAYLIACPQTGEAVVMDSERDVDRHVEDLGPISACGVGARGSFEEQAI